MGPQRAGQGLSPFLSVDRVGKSFGEVAVLDGVSFEVESGEILVLLGPSGSGKTTLLRILAGFEAPDSGSLGLAGRDITREPPARRDFGMVFQHYALFPHLTVGENVAFGLESRRLARSEVERRVAEALALVDLTGFENRRVHQISGGQQQRVALARALAPEPQILLLDEPLSNLDRNLRERTRAELTGTLRQVGITAVWVTHEQEEAFDVGDRVAVLQHGRLEQVGTPEELYLEPATPFVARFVGRASTLAGVAGESGTVLLRPSPEAGEVAWPATGPAEIEVGSPVDVLFRPEGMTLTSAGETGTLSGRVETTRFAGASSFAIVRLASDIAVEVAGQAAVGEPVGVAPRPGGPAPRVFPRFSESGLEGRSEDGA